jgi:hypothetical protein
MGATLEALIAAFCRLAKSLNHSEQMGWLVGVVGIEFTSQKILLSLAPLRILARTGSSGLFAPLPPRVFAECLPISKMVGRGGGDQTTALDSD